MSANIEQIKAMLERAGKTNLSQKQTIDLDKERLQLEATVNKEKIYNNLEEAAEDYADVHGFRVPYDGTYNFYDDTDVKASKEGFITGAKWQKELMLKDAVEGKVYFQLGDIMRVQSDDFENPDIHFGDKVKLIIVKED